MKYADLSNHVEECPMGLSNFTRILSNRQRGAGRVLYGLILGLR